MSLAESKCGDVNCRQSEKTEKNLSVADAF